MNGRISSGKKTKHISYRFFFITKKITKVEIDVEYWPTEKMWCDILNKPKKGSPYRLDKIQLMNVTVDYDNQVESKDNHPTILNTKKDNGIVVLPRNRNIPKADPNPVRRNVLGSSLKEVGWELEQIPWQKGFGEPP